MLDHCNSLNEESCEDADERLVLSVKSLELLNLQIEATDLRFEVLDLLLAKVVVCDEVLNRLGVFLVACLLLVNLPFELPNLALILNVLASEFLNLLLVSLASAHDTLKLCSHCLNVFVVLGDLLSEPPDFFVFLRVLHLVLLLYSLLLCSEVCDLLLMLGVKGVEFSDRVLVLSSFCLEFFDLFLVLESLQVAFVTLDEEIGDNFFLAGEFRL